MSNFDPNAILRGAQLTIVGALRALQNPGLFKAEVYRHAAIAVAAGIAIRLLVAIPVSQSLIGLFRVQKQPETLTLLHQQIIAVKLTLWFLSFILDFDTVTWDDQLVGGLDFIANSVLQVPFFLMSLMRYISPTLDHMFMDALKWVDQTYYQKHRSEDPDTLRATYFAELSLYQTHGDTSKHKKPMEAITAFLMRSGKRAGISLAIFALSYLPVVGRFVLPAASFYAFNNAVGPIPATVIFGSGIFLPRRYLVKFLASYFSSRSLMRELLEPYFSRVRFSREQKKHWFHDREGVLFGFGVGFYIFLKIPLLGVLIYGIAEASTAYLITKITDPPPPPAYAEGFAESQVTWKNKQEFLRLPLVDLDANNADTVGKGGGYTGTAASKKTT